MATEATEETAGLTALDWAVIVAGVVGLAVLLIWAYRDNKRPESNGEG